MKKIYKLLLTLVLSVLSLFTTFAPAVVKADGLTVADFDKTSIENDIRGLFNGQSWEDVTSTISKLSTEDVQILSFMEYCYSENLTLLKEYGLYLYVYNPTTRNFNATQCVVNMATSFDEEGRSGGFVNKKVQLCDSAEGDTLLKFKILETDDVLNAARSYAKTHEGKRRYDVVSFQFYTEEKNDKTGEDRVLGRSYYFSGYAKGFDNTSVDESTLESEYSELETLRLEVNQTYYRTEDFKDYVCDELNTAYFSIPNETLEKYGKLQAITAEWYEYKTTPIFVTSDLSAYQALKNSETYWGVDLSNNEHTSNTSAEWRVLWEERDYLLNNGNGVSCFHQSYNGYAQNMGSNMTFGNYLWNWERCLDSCPVQKAHNALFRLDWIFYKEVNAGDELSAYIVSSDDVKAFMAEYTAQDFAKNQGKVADGHGGRFAEGLFTDSIDPDRIKNLEDKNATRGYVCQTINADENTSLLVEQDKSAWDRFWTGVDYESKGYTPIAVLDNTIPLSGMSDETFGNDYYINATDRAEVKKYCLDERSKGNTPVLFRFANTDYYSCAARFDNSKSGAFYDMSKEDGYISQQTVFLDFDIISLTFKGDEGVETVIGVVASPLDAINDVTPPPDLEIEDEEWWKWIVRLLALVILAIVIMVVSPLLGGLITVLMAVLKVVFNVLLWAISAPFKLLGLLFGGNKRR